MNETPTTSDAGPEKKKTGSQKIQRVFWLSFLVVSLALAWYSFYAPPNEVAWEQDYAEAQALSAESGKPMILFFTATWCSPCSIMKRTVWADEEVTAEVNRRFVPLMIYAGDPGSDDLFARYQIGGTPVTIITDAQGNTLDWVAGKVDKATFLEMITSL